MSTVTTTVTVSTVHPSPVGGAIFTGRDPSGRWIRAVADRDHIFRVPLKGEVWQLTGQFAQHPVYGDQLHVAQSRLLLPTGRLLIRYLSSHSAFRGTGVGPAKAARLFEAFGDQLPLLLEKGDTSDLVRVIGEETAQKLVAAWQQNSQESAVLAFLDQHRVGLGLAQKILRYWPEDTVAKLRENPYRLLILTGWTTVDKMAGSIGIRADDERRLVAAAEASVYSRLDTAKDTVTEKDHLKRSIRGLLGCFEDRTPDKAIDLAVSDGTIVGDATQGYQPLGCVVMERYLMARFEVITELKEYGQPSLFRHKVSETAIDASIKAFEQQESMTLNVEQRAAVHMAATESLSVLTGGAGTGKTTVLKAIHCTVESLGGTVIQMALAGRAAQRLREATNREAYTIAGFLNQIRSRRIQLTPHHLVAIDESSMLDLMLMYRIVKGLPEGVRLLLVGDPRQLPPIGPGLVFHVMAASPRIRVQELKQIHRQAESTGIPSIAHQIRNGMVPELPSFNGQGAGVSLLECPSRMITNHLIDIVSELGGFGEVQILGAIKNGPAGINHINQTFHRLLTASRPRLHGWDLAESDPIIYTVNDYDRELYNGSLGRVEEISSERIRSESGEEEPLRLIADFDGRKIGLTDADLCHLALAYAITIHKAQGSQFRRVVIPVTPSRLLDRTLIYTALTRSMEQVIIIGDRQAFKEAIANPPSASLRKVGFIM